MYNTPEYSSDFTKHTCRTDHHLEPAHTQDFMENIQDGNTSIYVTHYIYVTRLSGGRFMDTISEEIYNKYHITEYITL